MCGIAYIKNLQDNKPVNYRLLQIYNKQKHRGQQGFGLVAFSAKEILTDKQTQEPAFLQTLNGLTHDEILLHHRLPTSTANTIKTAHPFLIKANKRKYYFVHNGIIYNHAERKKAHEKLGLHYVSQEKQGKSLVYNDSEALAQDFVLYITGKIDKIHSKGAVAFICLETDNENRAQKLFYYRNKSNPLKLGKTKKYFALASELENGENIKPNRLYYYDYKTKQTVLFAKLDIDDGWSYYSKKSYINYKPILFKPSKASPYKPITLFKPSLQQDKLKLELTAKRQDKIREYEQELALYTKELLENEQEQLYATHSKDYPLLAKLEQDQDELQAIADAIRQDIAELQLTY